MSHTKDSYSMLSNIIFNMKSTKKWDKQLFYYQLLPIVPSVVGTYLGILLPSELVRGLEHKWRFEYLMLYIIGLSLIMVICKMLEEGMREYNYRNSLSLPMYYEKYCYDKVMRLDYHLLENPQYTNLMSNTWNVLRNKSGFRTAVSAVPTILSSFLAVLWYGYMIGQKSLLIIILAIFHSFFNVLMVIRLSKKQKTYHKNTGKYAKEAAYINKQAMDRQAGKDIRIYRLQQWFLHKYDQSLEGTAGIYKQIHNGNFLKAVLDGLILFVLNCFSYTYLILLLNRGEINVSSFVLYIGLISSFSSALQSLMNQLLTLNTVNISLNYIRTFLDMPEELGWSKNSSQGGIGREKLAQIKAEGLRIQLKGISYCYPGETQPTLHDINLTITPGERLALIGLNGAGKTTLVKLLCGFYRPTKGTILINEIPISAFSRAEYYELVTVLFQDSTLLPLTLNQNLTGQATNEIDRDRLTWSLETAGFLPKYESLPQKGETMLVREVNKEALDFSGGERQKMLFARALYKVAPLMILDEPTAALDPIAENQMYQNFAEAAKGRTCVYISHRLSSTRFCDRILLMEQGRIVEEGTHDALMARNGQYAKLYKIQSKYYKQTDEIPYDMKGESL